jgi:hypothetical protein
VTRCPHCHAQARVERSAALRWRCGVCGGPIVPIDEGVARPHGELAHLVTAQRTRAMAVGWMAAAAVLGAIAVMGLGLAALVWLASHAAALVVGVVAGAAGALAWSSRRRAKARGSESRAALDQAWEVAAGEVVRTRPETTAAELATAMQTDEDHAQALLASLSAAGRVRVDVRDDAELAYRADESAATADAEGADTADRGPGQRAR